MRGGDFHFLGRPRKPEDMRVAVLAALLIRSMTELMEQGQG